MKIKFFSFQLPVTILIVALIIIFAITIVNSQTALGDPDTNGSITIVDALLVARYYVGLLVPDPFDTDSADVNCSGDIEIIDALLIARYYVGLITGFPGCNTTPAPTPGPGNIDYNTLIENWAREQGIDLTGYNINDIQSNEITQVIPGYRFFLLYLIQYPVAYGPPDDQLGMACIVAIDGDLAIESIADEYAMQEFYRAHQIEITTEAGCVLAIKAWLHLSHEYKNDGYYTFLVSDDDITVSHVYGDVVEWLVDGISRVTAGGEGAVTAQMAIDFEGLLLYVNEEFELLPGIRPICQSTKLLDPDPIVRKMAEQDLLAMGYKAKEYMFTQRAKASPELQKAMDALWERIVELEINRARIRELLSR
jgi:hypothetical protein